MGRLGEGEALWSRRPSHATLHPPPPHASGANGPAQTRRVEKEPERLAAGAEKNAGAGAGAAPVSTPNVPFRLRRTADKSSAFTRPSRLKSNRPVRSEVVFSARLTAARSSAFTRKVATPSPVSPTRLPK